MIGCVTLTGTFTEPVFIAEPPTANDSEPCVVRLCNVNPTGIEIRLAEWYCLDGKDLGETMFCLVMDKSGTTLPVKSIIETGSFAETPTNQNMCIRDLFNTIPVFLTTIASENEDDNSRGRVAKLSTMRFSYCFKEQEGNKNSHMKKTVHYIA